jgi:hypothetical protein
MERMGQLEEAEHLYQADAERYDYDGPVSPPLLGFYYRMARVEGKLEFEARFERLLSLVFPDGLEPLPEEMGTTSPPGGVFVDGNSGRLRRSGVRGGDVIVGLDGWTVRSLEQYDAIREFRPSPSLVSDMRLRVWRQTQYHDLEAEVRLRHFEVKMRTFGAPSTSFLQR